jgi:hypothetical protein
LVVPTLAASVETCRRRRIRCSTMIAAKNPNHAKHAATPSVAVIAKTIAPTTTTPHSSSARSSFNASRHSPNRPLPGGRPRQRDDTRRPAGRRRDLGMLLRTLSELLRSDARTRAELETRQGWVVNNAHRVRVFAVAGEAQPDGDVGGDIAVLAQYGHHRIA